MYDNVNSFMPFRLRLFLVVHRGVGGSRGREVPGARGLLVKPLWLLHSVIPTHVEEHEQTDDNNDAKPFRVYVHAADHDQRRVLVVVMLGEGLYCFLLAAE